MISKIQLIYRPTIWLVLSGLFALGTTPCLAQRHTADRLFPTEIARLNLKGPINQRLEAVYHAHILHQDVGHLIAPFRDRTETHMWQSEFWGKWFTSAVLAYRYRPSAELREKLDAAAKALIATQSPDGYIGNYAPESRLQQWDIWGRKYCMLGLLDHYDFSGDKESLAAAKGIADNLLDDLAKTDGIIVTKGNYRGMAASSVLEPFCLLYTRTKEQKYLDFAEEIVRQWETPDGPGLISKADMDVGKRFPPAQRWYSWEQGQKAYEMMSCYEGLLELYRITGNTAYKEAVEKTWENIRDTEINLAGSGASAEMWFGGKVLQTSPVYHYQETCVTVTWIKLSHQLLRLTGEARYADAVEQAYCNALLGSLNLDGVRWAKYTPLTGHRLPGSGQCGMDLNCCEASGPRGLFNLPGYVVMQSPDGVYLNYYIDGQYALQTPSGKRLGMTQQTAYPQTGAIKVKVSIGSPETFPVYVRIPDWSGESTLTVNGKPVPVEQAGGYTAINRQWADGDEIGLDLDMRGRVVRMGNKPQYAAIMRGPVLLARDARLSGPDMGAVISPVADERGYIALEPAAYNQRNMWIQFKALFHPESYTEQPAGPITVELCDYASAGNGAGGAFFMAWFPQLIDPRTFD